MTHTNLLASRYCSSGSRVTQVCQGLAPTEALEMRSSKIEKDVDGYITVRKRRCRGGYLKALSQSIPEESDDSTYYSALEDFDIPVVPPRTRKYIHSFASLDMRVSPPWRSPVVAKKDYQLTGLDYFDSQEFVNDVFLNWKSEKEQRIAAKRKKKVEKEKRRKRRRPKSDAWKQRRRNARKNIVRPSRIVRDKTPRTQLLHEILGSVEEFFTDPLLFEGDTERSFDSLDSIFDVLHDAHGMRHPHPFGEESEFDEEDSMYSEEIGPVIRGEEYDSYTSSSQSSVVSWEVAMEGFSPDAARFIRLTEAFVLAGNDRPRRNDWHEYCAAWNAAYHAMPYEIFAEVDTFASSVMHYDIDTARTLVSDEHQRFMNFIDEMAFGQNSSDTDDDNEIFDDIRPSVEIRTKEGVIRENPERDAGRERFLKYLNGEGFGAKADMKGYIHGDKRGFPTNGDRDPPTAIVVETVVEEEDKKEISFGPYLAYGEDPLLGEEKEIFPRLANGDKNPLAKYDPLCKTGKKKIPKVAPTLSDNEDMADRVIQDAVDKLAVLSQDISPSLDTLNQFAENIPEFLKPSAEKGYAMVLELIAASVHLATLETIPQLVSFLGLIIARVCGVKICKFFMQLTSKFFKKDKDVQPAVELGGVLNALTTNKHIHNLIKLIGMAVCVLMSGFANFDFDFALFKQCGWSMTEKIKATSFASIFAESLGWFSDVGYQVFSTGSIRPIFFSNPAVSQIIDEHEKISKIFEARNFSHLQGHALNTASIVACMERIDKVREQIYDVLKVTQDKSCRMPLFAMQGQFRTMTNAFQAMLASVKIKVCPWAFSLCGEPGVGKTTTNEHLHVASLAGMGKVYDGATHSVIENGGCGKFDSRTLNRHISGTIDDFAQTKPEFVQEAPTNLIIQIVNNAPAMVDKADVAEKGQHYYQFLTFSLTTNVQHLNASLYTMDPDAIMRRFIHIDQVVKDEHRLPGTTRLDPDSPGLKVKPGETPDCWWLRPCLSFKRQMHHWLPREQWIQEEGRPLGYFTLKELKVLFAKKAGEYYTKQMLYVAAQGADVEICTCGLVKNECMCPTFCSVKEMSKDEVDEHNKTVPALGVQTAFQLPYMYSTFIGMFTNLFKKIWYGAATIVAPYEWRSVWRETAEGVENAVMKNLHTFVDKSSAEIMECVPASYLVKVDEKATWWDYLRNRLGIGPNPKKLTVFGRLAHKIAWRSRARSPDGQRNWWSSFWTGIRWATSLSIPIGAAALFVPVVSWAFIPAALSGIGIFKWQREKYLHDSAISCVMQQQMELGPKAQAHLHKKFLWVKVATASMLTVLAGIALYKIWACTKEVAPAIFQEGDLSRDSKPGWFNMFGLTSRVPVSNNTTAFTDLSNVLRTKMVDLEYAMDGKATTGHVRGVMIKNNILLTVKHLFSTTGKMVGDHAPGTLTVSFNGGKTSCKNKLGNDDCIYQIGDKDLVLVYLHACFNCKDITDMFSAQPMPTGSFKATYSRLNGGSIEHVPVAVKVQKAGYHGAETMGYVADVEKKMATLGSCGSLLTNGDSHGCTILGVLFATQEEANFKGESHFCPISHQEIIAGLSEVRRRHTVLPSAMEVCNYKKFGEDIITESAIHPKSCLKDVESPHLYALGTRQGRNKYVSDIRKREISDMIFEIFGVPCKWGAPQFKGVDENGKSFNFNRAFNKTMMAILQGAGKVDDRYLKLAVEDWLRPLLPLMRKWRQVEDIRPLTEFEMVNGISGKRFMEVLKMATSMGLPVQGPKTPWFYVKDGRYYMTEELAKEFRKAKIHIEKGNRHFAWFLALLKDEAKPLEKYKVRVFYSCDVITTLLVRQYYLPIMRFLQFHNLTSEIAVGMNPMSSDWNDFIEKHAKKFMTDDGQCFALDYSHYDNAFSPNVFQAAVRCLEKLAVEGGYSETDLLCMKCLGEGLVTPIVAFNGTVMTTMTLHASGNPVTVIINSIVNCLLMRCYYYSLNIGTDFRSHVAVMTYGDDVLGSVLQSKRTDFNFLGYSKFLEDIGMAITHPAKDASADFHISKLDFLKRKGVYHPMLGIHLGAIGLESTFRSLHMVGKIKYALPDGTRTGNTEETTTSDVIDSAMAEFALHGQLVYEEMQKKMLELLAKFPAIHNQTAQRTYQDRMSEIQQSMGHVGPQPASEERYVNNPNDNTDGEGSRTQNPSLDSDVATLNNTPNYNISSVDPMSSHVITFTDTGETEAIEVPAERLGLQTYGVEDEANLGDYLKRPLKIASYNWFPGADLNTTFEPMRLYLTNGIISNKVRHFRNFTGKLHIRFVLNGNPFYYGRIMAAWKPLEQGFSDAGGDDFAKLMQLSTRMHCMLNPTDNTSPSLRIPFFFPNNCLALLVDGASPTNLAKFGTVEMRTLNTLVHANGSSNPVEINVMAWMEEFTLGGPTSSTTSPAVDERQGKVEKIATKSAKALSLMSAVPAVAPFASPLEMGSMMIAQTAKLFGWSKPEKSSGDYMIPQPIADMANSDGLDDVRRLVLDTKQGLTIDPATVGIPRDDELSVSTFVQRESLYRTLLWSPVTDAGTQLMVTWVDPAINYRVANDGAQYLPCGLVAGMHQFWTGSMRFRVEVVCSAYHKGRLLISYDPFISTQGISADVSLNNYTHIMDISECTNMTFEVGWGQTEPFRKSLFAVGASGTFTSSSVNTADDPWGNGFFKVGVFNSLVTPSLSSDNIYINIYVSGGEDMMFAAPTNQNIANLSLTVPPTARRLPAVSESMGIVKFMDIHPDRKIFYGTFGETTTSLRCLMKRYNYFSSESQALTNSRIWNHFLPMYPRMPYWRSTGSPSVGSWLEVPQDGSLFSNTCATPVSLLGSCFAGARGGMRWLVTTQNHNSKNLTMALWRRNNNNVVGASGSAWSIEANLLTLIPTLGQAMTYGSAYEASSAGMALMDTNRNQTLKVEIPFYSRNHFTNILRDPDIYADQGDYIFLRPDSLAITTTVNEISEVAVERDLYLYTAIAEDFSLFWFQNVPTLYRFSTFT